MSSLRGRITKGQDLRLNLLTENMIDFGFTRFLFFWIMRDPRNQEDPQKDSAILIKSMAKKCSF